MIEIHQAFKIYGNKQALDGLSFTAGEGKIIGLLGTNGAGKSTALKAIASLTPLDRGHIRIDGKAPSVMTRGKIAYLPDADVWYPWMKLADAMKYMKDMYWDWDNAKARHLLDFLELRSDAYIREASRGMQAKMKLLLALSRQAKYLLLDEPLSAIDPFARKQITRAIVEDFLEEGQTILIATQEIGEVEIMLDEVVFIHQGKLLLHSNVEALKEQKTKPLLDILKEVYDHARL